MESFFLKIRVIENKKKTKNVLCGTEWIYVTLFWVFVLWVCAEMERYFISFDFISPTQIIDRIFSLSVVFIFFIFLVVPLFFVCFLHSLSNSTLLPLLLQCWPVSEGPSSMASRWKLETRCKSWRNVKVWCSFYTLPMWGGYIQISCSLCENLERKRISFPEFETWVVRNTSVFSFNR